MKDKKQIWSDAPKAGIVLGGISIAYFFLNQWMMGWDSVMLKSMMSAVFWMAKLAACILLFRLFMKKFAGSYEEVTNSDTFAYGCAVGLLSAFFYSVFYLAFVKFINPEFFEQTIQTALQAYSSIMDSNSRDALEQMMPKMPYVTFVSNLFYCSIFGVILSAIFSRNIPSRNPFQE